MGGKVLIIDDEPDVATYLATALHANGYQAAVANRVASGYEELERALPDLICLDIMMPLESGISMYSHLKQDKATEKIPIVIISGVVHEGGFDIRSYVSDNTVSPPERFLEKPVDVELFLATIAELISATVSTRDQGDK